MHQLASIFLPLSHHVFFLKFNFLLKHFKAEILFANDANVQLFLFRLLPLQDWTMPFSWGLPLDSFSTAPSHWESLASVFLALARASVWHPSPLIIDYRYLAMIINDRDRYIMIPIYRGFWPLKPKKKKNRKIWGSA